MLLVLKIAFLFMAVWMTLVNVASVSGRENIPALNFVVQTVGIVGFITVQWLI